MNPMSSPAISYPNAIRLTLWPALAVAAAGLVIAGIFVATGQRPGQHYASALQPEISGVTIEQEPISDHSRDGALIITSVESDGPAHEASIEAGDRIILVDGQTIKSKAALRAIVEGNSTRSIHLRLQRGLVSIAVDLPVPHPPVRTMTMT